MNIHSFLYILVQNICLKKVCASAPLKVTTKQLVSFNAKTLLLLHMAMGVAKKGNLKHWREFYRRKLDLW